MKDVPVALQNGKNYIDLIGLAAINGKDSHSLDVEK